jgi:hypothetical protein
LKADVLVNSDASVLNSEYGALLLILMAAALLPDLEAGVS